MNLAFKNESSHKGRGHTPTSPHMGRASTASGDTQPGPHTTQGGFHVVASAKMSIPLIKGRGPAQHYLEGFQLALHLPAEVLTVLTKLALLGGLSNSIIKLSFQLQEEDPVSINTKRAPLHQLEQHPRDLYKNKTSKELCACLPFIKSYHKWKFEEYTSGFNWDGWLVIKQRSTLA